MPNKYPKSHLIDLMKSTFEKLHELRLTKGAEYAGDQEDDALANFRRNGKDAGISMETCWRIYAGKHWDSISQYIRDIGSGNTRIYSEPIEGRIDDLILYLILLKAMVVERRLEVEVEEVINTNTVLKAHQEHYGLNNLPDDPNPWSETGLPQN